MAERSVAAAPSSGDRRTRSERGSGTVLMLGVLIVVMVIGMSAVVICGYVLASHRARSAADLAALAGAQARASGGDACGSAETIAKINKANVLDCMVTGDRIDFVVTVSVKVAVGSSLAGLPPDVSAESFAGPVRQ